MAKKKPYKKAGEEYQKKHTYVCSDCSNSYESNRFGSVRCRTCRNKQKYSICIDCGKKFALKLTIDGVKRYFSSRRRCFSCSPIRDGKFYITKHDIAKCPPGYKPCTKCRQIKLLGEFSNNYKDGTKTSKCKLCQADNAKSLRRQLKIKCIEYKGGKCENCGYCKCAGALEFHHIKPDIKKFQISRFVSTKLSQELKEELDKCRLLCANCHRELEYNE